MVAATKQATTKDNGNYGGKTVLMFKRLVALAIALGLIIAATATVTSITHRDKNVAGTVIAYYENDYQRYAIDLLTESGHLEQWACLYQMWTKESNWRPLAVNKTSHASGIAQLKPITWRLISFKQTTDGYLQVEAGLLYIQRHYGGNICRAYAHHLAKGWY